VTQPENLGPPRQAEGAPALDFVRRLGGRLDVPLLAIAPHQQYPNAPEFYYPSGQRDALSSTGNQAQLARWRPGWLQWAARSLRVMSIRVTVAMSVEFANCSMGSAFASTQRWRRLDRAVVGISTLRGIPSSLARTTSPAGRASIFSRTAHCCFCQALSGRSGAVPGTRSSSTTLRRWPTAATPTALRHWPDG
jgi:hypothetical protein